METVAGKKSTFLERSTKFFLPKKLHKYVTPESMVAWKAGSLVTWGQVAIIEHWSWIVSHILVPSINISKVVWKEVTLLTKAAVDVAVS